MQDFPASMTPTPSSSAITRCRAGAPRRRPMASIMITPDSAATRSPGNALCRESPPSWCASRRNWPLIFGAPKSWVYKTYDHVLSEGALERLAASVGRYGATLCYVRHAAERNPPFTAERWGPHLIVGYIDRFAPQSGRNEYNDAGWEAVCRAMLDVHHDGA
jgi:hypothetical protein